MILAGGGLVLSLFANIIQYVSSVKATAASVRQMDFAEVKWRTEGETLRAQSEKLRAELEVFKTKEKDKSTERLTIQSELEKLNDDVRVWDDALIKDKLDLVGMESKPRRAVDSNDAAMAEAIRKNIVLQKSMIAMKTEQKNQTADRRSELEKRLGNLR